MNDLQEKVRTYITTLYHENADPRLIYHNFTHTQQVVLHTEEIMHYYDLADRARFIIRTAAWFHDTGHLSGRIRGHEERSVKLMQEFLSANACDKETIEQIAACILATRMPVQPVELAEMILCDADTYHLGTPEFFTADEQVKKELLLRESLIIDQWDRHALHFLQEHHYFTGYCQNRLNQGKLHNIALLSAKLNRFDKQQ